AFGRVTAPAHGGTGDDMELLPLNTLGARETSPGVIDFGVYFPWVSADDGNRLFVKIIHEHDQFLQDVPPRRFELNHANDATYGPIDHPDYLADVGVNCIEIMPVSNVALEIDWGFLPIGYFGVDERFGQRKDIQRLVEAAHERGIAVMLDVVYGHTSSSFAY